MIRTIDIDNENEGFPISAVKEMKILKQFNHRNLIKLYDIMRKKPKEKNNYKGHVYMIYENIEMDLFNYLNRGYKLSLPEIKCILLQIFEGVEFLHSNNIYHGNLQPSNILISEGIVKIADFGNSEIFNKNEFDITNNIPYPQMKKKVNCLKYLSPEILLGDKRINPASDIWALGCLIAELILENPLFNGKEFFLISYLLIFYRK